MNNNDYNSILFLDKLVELLEEEKKNKKKLLNPELKSSYIRYLGFMEGIDYAILAINNQKKIFKIDE